MNFYHKIANTHPPRSKFRNRVGDHPRVLGLGLNNQKICLRKAPRGLRGKVEKGRLKGYRIYTVTLEERATCPKTCFHWESCYGNNMQWALRQDHTAPDFLVRLEAEIDAAMAETGIPGILVRLHVLGDFYSVEYVQFWKRMLQKHKNLVVWGYTGHDAFSEIGFEVHQLYQLFEERAIIRHSNGGYTQLATQSIRHPDQLAPDTFICPEQTGKVKSCATCGVCWATTKNVAFLEH